jgi:uncharacterized membrane protein (UPF0136 family)
MKPFIPAVIALLSTILLGAIAALAMEGMDAGTWQGMDLAKAALENEYCEHNHMQALIRQPANSWSNLVYFFLGVWILCWGIQDACHPDRSPSNPIRRFPQITLWIAGMLIGLAFGSFFFHASLTKLGQHWDMTFTYALSLALACAAAWRLTLTRTKILWLLLAISSAIFMYAFKWSINGRIALPAIMAINFILLATLYLRNRTNFQGWLLIAVVLMTALAAFFRTIDLAKAGCEPTGWMQYHAAWHLCTGLAAFSFLAFLRAEKG